MQQMSPPELAALLAAGQAPLLLDVREPWEFETCRIEGSLSMPMNSVPSRMAELDPEDPVVCICHHGGRSMQVASYLERNGFTAVSNLAGGVHGWALQVDPAMPTY